MYKFGVRTQIIKPNQTVKKTAEPEPNRTELWFDTALVRILLLLLFRKDLGLSPNPSGLCCGQELLKEESVQVLAK